MTSETQSLQQQHNALRNELSGRGCAWNEPAIPAWPGTTWILDLCAMTDVERDTNAAIIEQVGEGEDEDDRPEGGYVTEEDAFRAAIKHNTERLRQAKLDPQAWVWVPDYYLDEEGVY